MPGEGLRWSGVLGKGQEMKITALGVVVVVGSIVILILIVDEIAKHLNGNRGNNGQQNTPNQ